MKSVCLKESVCIVLPLDNKWQAVMTPELEL